MFLLWNKYVCINGGTYWWEQNNVFCYITLKAIGNFTNRYKYNLYILEKKHTVAFKMVAALGFFQKCFIFLIHLFIIFIIYNKFYLIITLIIPEILHI